MNSQTAQSNPRHRIQVFRRPNKNPGSFFELADISIAARDMANEPAERRGVTEGKERSGKVSEWRWVRGTKSAGTARCRDFSFRRLDAQPPNRSKTSLIFIHPASHRLKPAKAG
jgi:hypothetical protein